MKIVKQYAGNYEVFYNDNIYTVWCYRRRWYCDPSRLNKNRLKSFSDISFKNIIKRIQK